MKKLLILPLLASLIGCGPNMKLVEMQVSLYQKSIEAEIARANRDAEYAKVPLQEIEFSDGNKYTVYRQTPTSPPAQVPDLSKFNNNPFKTELVRSIALFAGMTVPSVFRYLETREQVEVDKVRVSADRDVDIAQWSAVQKAISGHSAAKQPSVSTVYTNSNNSYRNQTEAWREDNSTAYSDNSISIQDSFDQDNSENWVDDHSSESTYTESPVVPIQPVVVVPPVIQPVMVNNGE